VEPRTTHNLILKVKHLAACFLSPLAGLKLPARKQLRYLPRFLTAKEVKLIQLLIFIIVIAAAFLGTRAYLYASVLIPDDGGEYIEGFVGGPKLINPLYTRTNDIDKDIANLVFSSLIKQTDQSVSNDLAARYEIAEDKKIYTFYLKQNIFWHDGEPLTAQDVAFTANAIKDKRYNSPLSGSLQGVEINLVDDATIQFILPEPFAPFLSSATFGILPYHIWGTIDPFAVPLSEYNIKPIGSGPFKFESLIKESTGKIKAIKLSVYENYHLKKPHIQKIAFKFFNSYDDEVSALNMQKIDGVNFLPHTDFEKMTNKDIVIRQISLPQYSALFLNQNKTELLKEKRIREAIALAIDKGTLINSALAGRGSVIHGPILPGYPGYHKEIKKYEFSPDAANSIMDELGFKKIPTEEYINTIIEKEKKDEEAKKQALLKQDVRIATVPLRRGEYVALLPETPLIPEENTKKMPDTPPPATNEKNKKSQPKEPEAQTEPLVGTKEKLEKEFQYAFVREKDGHILQLTLTTVNQPETVESAKILQNFFGEIGITLNLKIVEPEKIITSIIEPREYEMLLYGIITLGDQDPYAVWHSSQAKAGGINLSMYSNPKADILLEQARHLQDSAARAKEYIEFQNILAEDLPAIFLYNSTYSYPMHKKIKGFNLKKVTTPSDRFAEITDWYIKTKREFQF